VSYLELELERSTSSPGVVVLVVADVRDDAKFRSSPFPRKFGNLLCRLTWELMFTTRFPD